MILSTQYYRPPFPIQARWEADLEKVARTGFDSIYIVASWAWIESSPGCYGFDDYDRLIELSGREGLKVIVNLWSEIQPVWMHRLHPNAAMIDHMGREVKSSQLAYMQFGLTPGCCLDHPEVRERAGAFLRAVANRYASSPHVSLWDCWNEMRWMSQADGHVCFCDYSLQEYRGWLRNRYGSLDELNRSWQRRYVDWQDVQPPKAPARSYTDSLLWQQFITERISKELRWRYESVRCGDAKRPIIAHAAFPSIYNTGEYFEFEPALGRGNDWQLAQQVDGYGCSHFPSWFHPSPADYGARIEAVRCAAAKRPYWIAELQGGAAGHGLQAMEAVSADKQARWVWNGIARGAKAVNFWCWRDEVFGRESGGFGIFGDDGFKAARLASLSRMAAVFRENEPLLDAYQPAPAHVGVIFEAKAYQLDWGSFTNTGLAPSAQHRYPVGHCLQGYLRALERIQAPYDVIESRNLPELNQYRLIILPCPLLIDDELARQLIVWVQDGGTLLTEPSLGAFDDAGLFIYPAERPFAAALGCQFGARRALDDALISFDVAGACGALRTALWREDIVPEGEATSNALWCRPLGKGQVMAVGSFVGLSYWENRYADFERFLNALVEWSHAGIELACNRKDGETLQWRFGYSNDVPLLFSVNHGPTIEVEFVAANECLYKSTRAVDVTTGTVLNLLRQASKTRFALPIESGGVSILRFCKP